MSLPTADLGNATVLTATGSIAQAKGIKGILCSTTTSGTVVVTNTAGTAITGTITPSAGSYTPINANCEGLTITIANTINITVIWV